jgi:hypothetical protein
LQARGRTLDNAAARRPNARCPWFAAAFTGLLAFPVAPAFATLLALAAALLLSR